MCIEARTNFVPRFVIEKFGLLQWRCFHISNKELQINEEIRDKEIRVIDADGSQLGILTTKDAHENCDSRRISIWSKSRRRLLRRFVALWITANIGLNRQSGKRKRKRTKK